MRLIGEVSTACPHRARERDCVRAETGLARQCRSRGRDGADRRWTLVTDIQTISAVRSRAQARIAIRASNSAARQFAISLVADDRLRRCQAVRSRTGSGFARERRGRNGQTGDGERRRAGGLFPAVFGGRSALGHHNGGRIRSAADFVFPNHHLGGGADRHKGKQSNSNLACSQCSHCRKEKCQNFLYSSGGLQNPLNQGKL